MHPMPFLPHPQGIGQRSKVVNLPTSALHPTQMKEMEDSTWAAPSKTDGLVNNLHFHLHKDYMPGQNQPTLESTSILDTLTNNQPNVNSFS